MKKPKKSIFKMLIADIVTFFIVIYLKRKVLQELKKEVTFRIGYFN